jgi:DNA-binding CsgD family transcriptional regulator
MAARNRRSPNCLTANPSRRYHSSRMPALSIFSLIFSFTVGTVTYALAIALYRHQKTALVRHFILFLTFLLLMILCAAILYLFQSFSPDSGAVFLALKLISRILAVCLGISLFFFINLLFNIFQSRAAFVVILSIGVAFTLLVAITGFISFRAGSARGIDFEEFSYVDLLMRIFMLYPIVTMAILSKRIENPAIYRMIRAFLILCACFIPLLLLDEWGITITLGRAGVTALQIQLLSFPLFYIIFNSVLIYYGFKYYIREAAAALPAAITDGFIRQYGISERENEIIKLLLEGCGNREIGERLFISIATVRNHLHNVFEKTGAKNRVDLLRRAGAHTSPIDSHPAS